MKACIVSLGCPKNLTDTEVIMGKLACSGYTLIAKPKYADIIIVNTCAFLKSAREESLATIKHLKMIKKKNAKIYVAGCLPKYLGKVKRGSGYTDIRGIESIGLFDSHTPRIKATNPWTAYVKISEGCNNKCAYCLIPAIRGKLKARPVNDILNEAKELAARGVKEIIYVAQDTTAHPDFAALLSKTANIKKIKWIRVMYTHPAHITDDIISTIAKAKKVCKYIDLPIQHICDNILMKMRRNISRLEVFDLIDKLRRKIRNLTIRTSLIVGFPGETEKDFVGLVDFIKKVRFERLGVFKFSREEGTPAAKMRGQVPDNVKEKRFGKLMSLQKQISRELNKKLVGKIFEVLIENCGKNACIGRTYMDAPEIDGSVKIYNNTRLKPGDFVRARVTKASAYDLEAVCIT